MTTTCRLRTSLSISVLAVLSAAAAPAAEVRGRISGDGGKPVAHAVVRLLPEGASKAKAARVETADDGTFAATGLTGERFTVRVEAKGYASLTQGEIPAEATVQLRLPHGVKLAGILRRRAEGTPIEGATVLAWEKAAEPFGEDAYRSAKSAKDGRFTIVDLPEGKVSVEAKASGLAPAKSASVAVPKAEFALLLDPAGGVTGLVTDTAGDPVSGADVAASWGAPGAVKRKSAKTGTDGRFRIAEAVPDAVNRMVVRAPKFLLAARDGVAPADGVVDFMLEHGGSITGTVRGFDGKALASFHVNLRATDAGSSGGGHADQEFNDPSGAFRIDELDPGTYTIEVAADRYASVKKEDLDVAAERVSDAGTLTLQSRTVLRGRVVSARDRTPIAGATINIARIPGDEKVEVAAESTWSVTSAPDGTFTTPSLPEGTFDLAAAHPQFAPARLRVSFRPDADAPEAVVEMYRGGALTGSVVDGKLEPVAGVRIVASQGADGDSRVADTGSDGHYYMDGLAPGAWTVSRQTDRQGGAAAGDSKLAAIREGETTTVDFDEKPKVSVSGVVMKGETPMPNASIYFVAIDNNLPRDGKSTQADAEGRFRIGLLHGGRYQVSVVFGAASASNGHSVVTLNIPDQPEVRQDIIFTAQAISGHVVDPDRRGIKGALVTALRQGTAPGDTPRQATTMTVDDGAFRIEALDPGTYRVTARAKAFASDEEFPVVVAETEPEPDLLLTLQRGWIMRGRLLDPQGKGVPGALVVVAPEGAAESGYLPSQTDATGAFRITAPADGPVNVAAIAARFAPAVATNIEQAGDGAGAEVVLQANAGGDLRVRVVHRAGEPATGIQLAFQPVPLFPGCDVVMDRNRPRPTGPDGSTVIPMLYPGSYLVSIPGRRDTPALSIVVSEGTVADLQIEIP